MTWLPLAIAGYFLLAIASIGDKFILTGPLPSPRAYAFFIGLLGALTIPFFMPFGFAVPHDILTVIISLATGSLWIIALAVSFEAVRRVEISRVVPAIGAFVPIFTLLATS